MFGLSKFPLRVITVVSVIDDSLLRFGFAESHSLGVSTEALLRTVVTWACVVASLGVSEPSNSALFNSDSW